jgi:hypothetical protein
MSRMEDQRYAVLTVGLHTWKCGTPRLFSRLRNVNLHQKHFERTFRHRSSGDADLPVSLQMMTPRDVLAAMQRV